MINSLRTALLRVQMLKNRCIKEQQYEMAAELRDLESYLIRTEADTQEVMGESVQSIISSIGGVIQDINIKRGNRHPVPLINGIEMNRANPDTFHIPSREDKADLRVGEYVKVGAEFPDRGERFWCEILTVRDDGLLHVKIANELVTSYPVDDGDEITVHPDYVIGIYEPHTKGI